MCKTCGCDDDGTVRVIDLDRRHAHDDHILGGRAHGGHGESGNVGRAGHDARGARTRGSGGLRMVDLDQRVLAKNDDLAADNRAWFTARRIIALNLMSSPGSGKTTLLERTVHDLAGTVATSVIEGDQETVFDAERIRATGCRVVQINTGAGCHLDATMVAGGVRALSPMTGSVVFIENVGNLVCPALFDLGESARVVIMSVTEGADKPLKYPYMFRAADLVLINKVDLLPYVDFDMARCRDSARGVNPSLEFIELSARSGAGIDQWYDWLRSRRAGPA